MPLDAKLNDDGRVVVPAPARRHLGASPGDRLIFVLDEGGVVRVMTLQSMLHALWANNQGGDNRNSGEEIRMYRDEDLASERASAERIAADVAADTRSEEQITKELLGSLGL